MSGVPLTLKCPRGEEWPASGFKSFVNIKEEMTYDAITFTCPAGHTFTLKRAVKTGMFTEEEAQKILKAAQAIAREVRYGAN